MWVDFGNIPRPKKMYKNGDFFSHFIRWIYKSIFTPLISDNVLIAALAFIFVFDKWHFLWSVGCKLWRRSCFYQHDQFSTSSSVWVYCGWISIGGLAWLMGQNFNIGSKLSGMDLWYMTSDLHWFRWRCILKSVCTKKYMWKRIYQSLLLGQSTSFVVLWIISWWTWVARFSFVCTIFLSKLNFDPSGMPGLEHEPFRMFSVSYTLLLNQTMKQFLKIIDDNSILCCFYALYAL